MPKQNKPKKNLLLAEKVEAWATKYRELDDGYVAGLLVALSENKNLQTWADLDPLDYLPIPEGTAGAKLASRTRFIVVIRNVLVFAPVALTWAAVGKATTAFAIYVKQNSNSVANFLDFWQNGYKILPNEWRIANVAQLDFLIIIAVIVLTLLSSVLGRRADEMQSKFEVKADKERMILAVEIASFLFEKRSISTLTMNQSMATAINRLLNATDSLEVTTKALAKTFKETKAPKPVREPALPKFDFSNYDFGKTEKKRFWRAKS